MATDSAPASLPPVRRQFWQLPVFVLGVTAAVFAWRAYPSVPASAREATGQHLHSLLQAFDKKADWKQVEAAVAKLTPLPDELARDPQAAFLVGSGHVLLAERGPTEAAADHWAKAHKHLAPLDPAALVVATDQARCRFRAAKAAAAVGLGEPAAVIAALDAVPPGEEPGERSRLIAETAMRMTPPDLKRAKEQLTAYLSGPARGTPATLAKYTLQLSGLCAAAGESDKARTWLSKVGPSAPADLQASAKVQLAQMATADRDPNEAVKLLQSADQLPGLPDEQRTLIRYEAGRGLQAVGNPTAAKDYLTKAADGVGPAGVAARVRLAMLAATDLDPKPAVPLLEAVAGTTRSPAEFHNPHVSLAEVRTAFESAVTAVRKVGDYDSAVRLVSAYGRVAEPMRDRELGAEVQAAWGEALLPTQKLTARDKLTKAAADLEAVAAEKPKPADSAALLTRALGWYRLAEDAKGTADVIAKLNALPGAPTDVAANAKFAQAEQALTDGRFDDGVKRLGEVAQAGGVVGTRATVRLALAHTAEGKRLLKGKDTQPEGRRKVDYGVDLLTQVANRNYDSADERAAQQEAVYELGKLQISKAVPWLLNYADAETRFRRLLREAPTGPYADHSGLYLGICLIALAVPEPGSDRKPPSDATQKLTEALDLFAGLTKSADGWVRGHAEMRQVNVLLLLKKFDDLPAVCDRLSAAHRGTVQELVLLKLLYLGYKQARRPDLGKPVLDRMQSAFAALPPTAFGTEMEEFTRAHWVKFFEDEKR
jgi:hypothetical protein